MKIAITSSNGQTVDTHFGHTELLYIYELSPKPVLVEKRTCDKYCSTDSNHDFRADKFSVVYDKLKDCSILYTKKIGDTPMAKLLEKGVKVIEFSGEVNEIFE